MMRKDDSLTRLAALADSRVKPARRAGEAEVPQP
jgi:hypothetical protein